MEESWSQCLGGYCLLLGMEESWSQCLGGYCLLLKVVQLGNKNMLKQNTPNNMVGNSAALSKWANQLANAYLIAY